MIEPREDLLLNGDVPLWKLVVDDLSAYQAVICTLRFQTFRRKTGALVACLLEIAGSGEDTGGVETVHRVFDLTDETTQSFLQDMRDCGKMQLMFELPDESGSAIYEVPLEGTGFGSKLTVGMRHVGALQVPNGPATLEWFAGHFDPVWEETGDALAGWEAAAADEEKLPAHAPRADRDRNLGTLIYSWRTVIIIVILGALSWAGRYFLGDVAPDIADKLIWPGIVCPVLAAGILAGTITR